MKKISVIIPTLQKNKDLLINLLHALSNDNGVDEIIVIDNSLKGIEENIKKVKLITPKKNLFVNPSWNLGVEKAKNEIIALLNDDITIPINFCSNVAEKLKENMGILGANINYVEVNKDIVEPPKDEQIFLEETKYRPHHFGMAMFFYKTSFYKIPHDLKIFFGDDWLLFKNKQTGKKNYLISGQKIYHFSSLTVKTMPDKIYKQERKIYKKHTLKWYQHFFDLEKRYEGYRIRLFGINSKLIPYKKEEKCQK